MNRITQLYEEARGVGLSQADAREWAEQEHAKELVAREEGRLSFALTRTRWLQGLGRL